MTKLIDSFLSRLAREENIAAPPVETSAVNDDDAAETPLAAQAGAAM